MSKKIAIMVIHGIGEQEPFETLDAFVKPFSKLYLELSKEKHPQISIQKKHNLTKFPDWIESYVSLAPDITAVTPVDIYEYYWAYMTQRQVTFNEIVRWVFSVAKGAKGFYRKQRHIKRAGIDDELFKKDGEFSKFKYVVKTAEAVGFLRIVGLTVGRVFAIVPPLWRVISGFLQKVVVDFFGDVVIYTSSDKKSAFFPVRQRILNGAIEKAKVLLKEEKYSEVMLVGHSLGSAIAYDVLDRINKEMNVDVELKKYAHKLKGLVTFGSPLDKIAFFFDENINKEKQDIRYAIVSQLHSFKRVNVDVSTVENGVEQYLEHIKWINFWSKPDPVCGHLDVYRDVENIEMDFSGQGKSPIQAHSLYWQSFEMYEKIIKEFGLI